MSEGRRNPEYIDQELSRISRESEQHQKIDSFVRKEQAEIRADNDIARIAYQAIDGRISPTECLEQLVRLGDKYPELTVERIIELANERLANDERIRDPELAQEIANTTKSDRERLRTLSRLPLQEFHHPEGASPEEVGAFVRTKLMEIVELRHRLRKKEHTMAEFADYAAEYEQFTDAQLQEIIERLSDDRRSIRDGLPAMRIAKIQPESMRGPNERAAAVEYLDNLLTLARLEQAKRRRR